MLIQEVDFTLCQKQHQKKDSNVQALNRGLNCGQTLEHRLFTFFNTTKGYLVKLIFLQSARRKLNRQVMLAIAMGKTLFIDFFCQHCLLFPDKRFPVF